MFVKLTNVDRNGVERKNPTMLRINEEAIESYYRDGPHTLINMMNGEGYWYVKETPEEIDNMIEASHEN